jgi:hypothetical protein
LVVGFRPTDRNQKPSLTVRNLRKEGRDIRAFGWSG